MARPLVTIVTPSYNQARYLGRTIDSVLGQSYPHIEYLVFDGGSNDRSQDILASYGSRIRWVSEKDRGQAHAINKGLIQARGDILAYLNSDDVLLPGAVEAVVQAFADHPEWDLLYGDADWIDEADAVLEPYPTAAFSGPKLLQYCFLCQPATFWRRRLTQRIGLFNEDLRCCLDYEYWLRAHQAGARLEHLPVKLAGSRLHDETKTLSLREPVYLETIRVQKEHIGFVELAPFYGLWRHRLKVMQQGGLWRFLPGAVPLTAACHFLGSNLPCTTPWRLLAGLLRGARRAVGPSYSPASQR